MATGTFSQSNVGNGAASLPNFYSRNATSGHRRSHSDGPRPSGRVARSNSASNILDTHEDFQRRLYDPLLAPHLQRRAVDDNAVTDLREFLLTTEPPPKHFMSIPEGACYGRGRAWVKWAKIGKRSRSAPRPIRLPDTAVSGTTIGGYRHIAITIPTEAYPLGDIPRSQYPVYSQGGEIRPLRSANGSVKSVMNDKGVVTVLRTVNEHEPQGPPRRSASYSGIRYGTAYNRTPSRTGYAVSNGSSSLPPSRGSGSMALADDRSQLGKGPVRPPRATPRGFPARASSKTKSSAHAPASIDSIIAQDDALRPLLDVRDEEYEAELAARKYANKPLPTIKSEKIRQEEETTGISNESGATLLKQSPLGTDREKSPAPTNPAANRRDKVRDKKMRDMEALRSMKQQEQPASTDDTPAVALPRRSSKRMSQEAKEAQSGGGMPTFSPIRVVVDVEPSPITEEAPQKHEVKQTQLETPRVVKNRNSAPGSLTPPILPKDKPAETTAPESASTQPQPLPQKKQNPLDRTSLLRRREWAAVREQERKAREARASVRAKAKQLAAGLNEESGEQGQSVDREILRLYEAFREHRFRDMERRLRRLERNGDVWLRALVPVLETLNHHEGVPRPDSALMPGQNGAPETRNRSWTPEEELATHMFNRDMYRRGAAALKRASSSHRTLREEMADADAASLCGSLSESEDLNGLDTLEPLMRELAGAAALRQMRSGRLLHAY